MLVNSKNIKLGQILVEQFGYTMTLYNFYKVLSIKNKTIKLQKLVKIHKWHDFLQCDVKPTNNLTDKPITKRFNKYDKISVDKYSNDLTIYNPNIIYTEDHAD